jgi:hypothetical protein
MSLKGRTRPLERRAWLTGLRTTADFGTLVASYESVTRHLEPSGDGLDAEHRPFRTAVQKQ